MVHGDAFRRVLFGDEIALHGNDCSWPQYAHDDLDERIGAIE